MWKPIIRSSIIGGIVVFLWAMISWTVLPFHGMMFKTFENQSEVVSTIKRAAPENGVYVIPDMSNDCEEKDSVPFIFMNVSHTVDFCNMTQPIVIGLITQIIGAGVVTFLLLQAKAMKFWYRVRFVTIVGLLIGFLASMPAWNWWHYPFGWAFLEFIDYGIAWFLGGLVIGKLATKKK